MAGDHIHLLLTGALPCGGEGAELAQADDLAGQPGGAQRGRGLQGGGGGSASARASGLVSGCGGGGRRRGLLLQEADPPLERGARTRLLLAGTEVGEGAGGGPGAQAAAEGGGGGDGAGRVGGGGEAAEGGLGGEGDGPRGMGRAGPRSSPYGLFNGGSGPPPSRGGRP